MDWSKTILGMELGSTRIKAVLIGDHHEVLADGNYEWENRLEDGYWTYHLDDVWTGVQEAYRKLAEDVKKKYGETLSYVGAIGVSAMMHGYLPFDQEGNQLAPFRTWRNTTTGPAAKELTSLFGFNIPQRWSIAHLYQAMLNGEEHVKKIAHLMTLAGYVHWKLTGEHVIGIGDASGMFPIDSSTCDYDAGMVKKFNEILRSRNISYQIQDILPRVLCAGEAAGKLTEEGAKLLDLTGALLPGIPLCPPEGDAGTGMAATNSVAPRTGNVSAGTSLFAMIVLEKPLSKVREEIDVVATPDGAPTAMVHCNTCTSDLDAWVSLLGETAKACGATLSKSELYELFYQKALEADPDCGGIINYNCFSGEPVSGLSDGRPMVVRRPDAKLNLPNFARAQVYSAMATLAIGMDTLLKEEGVKVDSLVGQGGMFKTPYVAQKLLAGALGIPVSVMETAGEGGPWGMALLAAYMLRHEEGETLEQYLKNKVFAKTKGSTLEPDPRDEAGFVAFIAEYKKGLAAEQVAVEALQ